MISKLAVFCTVILAAACTTPPYPNTVSSQGQSGGVTAGSVGTINQTAPPYLKSPYLSQLQKFYAEGMDIRQSLDSPDMTDKQIDDARSRFESWAQKTAFWIGKNLTEAAALKFLRTHIEWGKSPYLLNGEHKANYAIFRSNMMFYTDQMLDNLEALMTSPAMYPQ